MSRAVVSSISIHSAAGDLGLHHGLDGLFALACDANGELIELGHHGVMIEDKSTGDSSVVEVQVCQGLEFSDVGNSCKQTVKIKIIMG